MKFCRYLTTGGAPAVGIFQASGVVPLQRVDKSLPSSMLELIEIGDELATRLGDWQSIEPTVPQPRLLAPLPNPQKILCVGLNYRDHAQETGRPAPTEPVIFGKYPSSITDPGANIRLPKASTRVDYEAELVVVIGRRGRDIAAEDALDHVFGYCCGHDVSARDWQFDKPGGQWMLGKSFDTFAPIGPYIAHKSMIADPGNLAIEFRLNGDRMQHSNTAQLIFDIPTVIEYVSQVVTLVPGDLIFTGTPAGVGAARTPPRYLQPGDLCEVELEGLGVLTNRCESV